MTKTAPTNGQEFTELTEMQQFVLAFINQRAKQDSKFSDKGMKSFYIQNKRVDRLREFIAGKFTGAGIMKKSESLDFMLFLLENYLKGNYPEFETFNEYHLRLNGVVEKSEGS